MSSKPRERDIDVKWKKIRQYKIPKKFKVEHSVFKEYVEPDYEKLVEKDVNRPKLDRVFKDPETCAAVCKLIVKDIHIMLDHFHNMIANSRYPQIAAMHLVDFCKELYIIDKLTL